MSTSTGKSQFIPQIYIAGHTPSGRAAFGADFDHALMRNPTHGLKSLCGKDLREMTTPN
jgi:hypothetical protein